MGDMSASFRAPGTARRAAGTGNAGRRRAVIVWPVRLGVAMMKRSAATISATSTPRPSALSPCTLSKLARLCGPETIVTDGAMPQTRMRGREGAGAKLGQAGEADLGDGVAEEIRIGRGELGVEQVDDQPAAPPRAAKARRQQGRRAQIDVEMRRPSSPAVKSRDIVMDEARGIVDQQPRRRQPVERGDDRLGGAGIGEVGLRPIDASPSSAASASASAAERLQWMSTCQPSAASARHDRRADPLRAAGDDRGPGCFASPL